MSWAKRIQLIYVPEAKGIWESGCIENRAYFCRNSSLESNLGLAIRPRSLKDHVYYRSSLFCYLRGLPFDFPICGTNWTTSTIFHFSAKDLLDLKFCQLCLKNKVPKGQFADESSPRRTLLLKSIALEYPAFAAELIVCFANCLQVNHSRKIEHMHLRGKRIVRQQNWELGTPLVCDKLEDWT